MEAIKCPNCGCEQVRQLTEEKYECLGCDNVFLVHNLSKEFRQTDAHITTMHEDLKNVIEEIKIQGNVRDTELKATFENAFHLLEIKKYDLALEKFEKLCVEESNTYQSWWGKFLAITKNMEIFVEEIACSDEVIDCISNMRMCKNYTQEMEDIVCRYFEKGFEKEKNSIESKIEYFEKKLDNSNHKMNDLEIEFQQLGTGNRMYNLENELSRMSITEKLVALIGVGIAEIFVIYKLFFKWLGSSIDIIHEPLDAVGLGKATLHFLAIPFKFIIGVVVVLLVAWLVVVIVTAIYQIISGKEGVESKLSEISGNVEKNIHKRNLWAQIIEEDQNNLIKLKKQASLYEKIDLKDLSSLTRFKTEKSNYTNLQASNIEQMINNENDKIESVDEVIQNIEKAINDEAEYLCKNEADGDNEVNEAEWDNKVNEAEWDNGVNEADKQIYCSACGAPMETDMNFCMNCGARRNR